MAGGERRPFTAEGHVGAGGQGGGPLPGEGGTAGAGTGLWGQTDRHVQCAGLQYAAGVHEGRDEQVRRGVVEAPGAEELDPRGVWATTSNTTETVADRRLALWACTTVTFHREFSQFQPRGGSRASADFRTARASSEVPDVGPLHSDSSHRHACHS